MAVYTQVGDDELVAFLADYDVGNLLSFKGIAEGVENSNYLVATTAGQFILTLYEKRFAEADLPFFVGLMAHLAANGISCPTPLTTRDGKQIGQLSGRPAALISFLEGFWLRKPKPENCHAVGRALAELHAAGTGFDQHRTNALSLADWTRLFARFEARADEIHPDLGDAIATELHTLEALWPDAAALPAGVIHADLFPDNVFFRDGQLSGIIDFYFACNDHLAYDIAIALNAWCFETNYAFNLTKGRALLSGYEQVRELEANEADLLPILCRGAALRFLLTRAFDWLHTDPAALVKPHDPRAYLRRLWVHQSMTGPADYGWRNEGAS
ncbi:MAG: homoserine kinase [Pseudomonadota bacterium]